MNKFTRYTLSIIGIIILIIVFTPIFASLNEIVFGSSGSIFFINFGPIISIIAGFILSYTFFIPLTFTIFFNKPEKYYAILTFIGFELFFMLSDIPVFLLILLIAVIGWLIGEGILRLYKMIKK